MIKTSSIKYVKAKRYDIFSLPCIPTGKVRGTNGEKEAEFISFMSRDTERYVWLKRDEIFI